MKKTIITVVGKDHSGIIAGVCTYLAEAEVNILDITQTIVDGYFNMMMVTDFEECNKEFGVAQEELNKLGDEMGVQITCQKEEIFSVMHRL